MRMTEDKIVDTVKAFLETRFPKTCYNCNHVFPTLKDYLLYTENIGKPVSYDAQRNKWKPLNPMGTMALANCKCGSTLSLSSHGLPLLTLWRLLSWTKRECRKQNIEPSELLERVRKKIDKKVLAETESEQIKP